MRTPALHVLYEDNHLLVVNKPANLPTMGVAPGRPSLVRQAKRHLKEKYGKPGNVYLGVVSRLDAMVSGVIVLARTSKAAARLTEQFKSRDVTKTYWAIVEQAPTPLAAECLDWVRKNERRHRMEVVRETTPQARDARLRYHTLSEVRGGYFVQVELITGRKHQVRLQLSARGAAVVGDHKYGADSSFELGIALHARRLELTHPVRKTPVRLVAPVPKSWRKFGRLPDVD